MKLLKETKAISTFILIILMLCSVIFGALISYLWVMSIYYNMPEDTTLLIVTDAVFPGPPTPDLTYFNVTILNPSNSISDVNITAIRLSVEGRDESYDINETEPEPLPFLIRRGTRQTFKCKRNWGNFAGEIVRIEPVAVNASTKSYSYVTPRVKLNLTPTFDESQSVEYFNLTIENSAESVINLTISEIMINAESINENVTPPLPYLLSINTTEIFRCNWNWDWRVAGRQNVTVKVTTEEGYESVYVTNELSGAYLYIDEISFDYTRASYFNLTVSSSEYSTATAMLDKVNLTLPDETTITLNTIPPLNIIEIPISPNQSLPSPIRCLWDWNAYRNETITVSVYTRQGFTTPTMTVITPSAVVWNITDVKFDLDYTEHFLVNVTNMGCSLHDINVTKILLEENETLIDPPFAVLTNGTEIMFNCTFDWKHLRGQDVVLTAVTKDGLNVSRIVIIPSVELELLGENFVFGDLRDIFPNTTVPIPYVNITISSSNNSLQNVTLTKIILEIENGTLEIDSTLTYPPLAPNGYILKTGETVTVICLWNWVVYLARSQSVKVTVYTAEGFQASRTWFVTLP